MGTDIYYLPFDSVESELEKLYAEDDFPHRLAEGKGFSGPKDLFHSLQRDEIMSAEMINQYICERNEKELEPLCSVLKVFLSRRDG